MKIFLDFDGVIFNTKNFVVDLDKIYFKNGASKEKLDGYKKIISETSKSKGVVYRPKDVVVFVAKGDKKSQVKIVNEVDVFLKKLKKYVYLDALFFLNNFPRADVFLLSYGDRQFQKKKVFGSKTDKYFHKLFINKHNKIDFICKKIKREKCEENVFLIDDKLENLTKVEEIKKEIITIWVNRFKMKNHNLGKVDYEVKNLKEALKIIRSKK